MSGDLWDRYGAYLGTPPHQVLEWNDAETGAQGWLVVNSLRGGAAGGGTRMHKALTRDEVTYLAKAMELKFAYSGPPIGGGKSGIAFDPTDPRRDDVLRRWYAAIRPLLASRYGTGGDVNVDEQRDVEPLCAEQGLAHPQEGIVRGHLGLTDRETKRALSSLKEGLRLPAGSRYGLDGSDLTVSDLITGYGVARAARRLYEHRGESLEGVGCVVEGFGTVGAAAALYLAREGARVVGILDASSAVASPEGLDEGDVSDLLRRRKGRELPEHPQRVQGPEREAAYRSEADLFIPAAISGSVDSRRLGQLARHGVRRMVCGANQPFQEVRLGETVTAQAADQSFDVVPEIIASLGTAHTFYHLMTKTGVHSADEIFEAVGRSVDGGVDAVMERVGSTAGGLMATAVEIALERTA